MMKGFVSKALSKNVRVLPNAVKAPKLRSFLKPATRVVANQHLNRAMNASIKSVSATATPSVAPSFAVLNNYAAGLEVTAESLPQEITWLSGAPGAGKGTNSKFISEICGYKAPSIVVSSLLEQPEFKRIKDAGGIVDDASVFKLLTAELAKPQYRNGVVVDGFPRTQSQAEWLASLHRKLSSGNKKSPKFNFIMLNVDEETSIARQLARGAAIRAQNSIIKSTGGLLMEERATDICGIAAKVRYQGFIEKYEAISQTLAINQFSCHVVDAGASVESVRQSLKSYLTPSQPSTIPRFQRQFLASFEALPTHSVTPVVASQLTFA